MTYEELMRQIDVYYEEFRKKSEKVKQKYIEDNAKFKIGDLISCKGYTIKVETRFIKLGMIYYEGKEIPNSNRVITLAEKYACKVEC